jgi:glyoxylase-like metal-dependent hydrolase (beta-lactamase superfamily II)
VHVYVIRQDPLTLVDTGVKSPESRAALELAFDRLGLCLEDVQRVILTHYHRDHLGQAQSIRDLNGDLEVWAHADEVEMIEAYSIEREENIEGTDALFEEHGVPAEVLEQHNRWRRGVLREFGQLCEPTQVDRVVRDGDRIPFKDFELAAIHAPGHTLGHLLLHEEQSGALLTGDHIVVNSVPSSESYYLDTEPDPGDPVGRRPRFKGLPEYMKSVRSLRRHSFRKILPAVGGTMGRPDRLIEGSLLFYDVRIQRIERGLRKLAAMKQDVTAWEIWTALFPKADRITDLRTSMMMVIGSLDVLEENGSCLSSRRDDGTLIHRHV